MDGRKDPKVDVIGGIECINMYDICMIRGLREWSVGIMLYIYPSLSSLLLPVKVCRG